MQAILQGDLRRFPAGELLTILRRHDGTLAVVSTDRRTRVVFRDGAVAAAESSEPSFELASMLATYGLLTKEQVEAMQTGGIESIVTDRHRGFQASEIIFDLFLWNEGKFAFSDDATVSQPLALDVDKLIEEGSRRAAEMQKVLQLYPDDQVIFRVVEDPGPQTKISLSAEEFRLLFRIGAGRSLRQIVEDSRRPPIEIYPVIHQLEEGGLIARAGMMAQPKPAPVPFMPQDGDDSAGVAGGQRDAATVMTPIEPAPQRMPSVGGATVLARPEPPAPAAPPPPPPPQPLPPPPVEATMIQMPPSRTEADSEPVPDPTAPQMMDPGLTTSGGHQRALVGSLTQEGTEIVFPLLEEEILIGRDGSNQIAIPDGSISSRHAKLSRNPAGFFIEDIGSRNGTFVNGEKVTEKRLLADNDLVRVGKILLTFNLAAEMRAGETTQPETPIA